MRLKAPSKTAAPLLLGVLAAACSHETAPGTVLVTSGFTDEVLRLDAATGSPGTPLDVNVRIDEVDEPHGIAVSPDGAHVFVSVAHGSPTLWKYETPDLRLVGRVELPQAGAGRIGLSPDGSRALVPDYFRGSPGEPTGLVEVDVTTMAVAASHDVCDAPHDAAFSPSGDLVVVTCALGNELVVLEGEQLTVAHRIPLETEYGREARPMNVVWAPNGSAFFVTLMGASKVAAFASPSGESMGSVEVGARPAQLAITKDGALLAVANRGDRSISLVDPLAMRERRRVDIAVDHPHGVAFDHQDEGIYVSAEGTSDGQGAVVALDRAGTVRWSVEVGNYNLGIAFLPTS